MPHETTLVSMKLDRTAKDRGAVPAEIGDRPAYPYGLSVTLDNDALEKLELTKLPTVGKSLYLTALVDVTSVSEHESRENGKMTTTRSVSLQITDLALGPAGSRGREADVLYNKEKA